MQLFSLSKKLTNKQRQQIIQRFVISKKQNSIKQNPLFRILRQQQREFNCIMEQQIIYFTNKILPNIQSWNYQHFSPPQSYKYKQNLQPKFKNQTIKILKLIQHIDFTNLLILKLNYQEIDNFQPLTYLKCDQITQIQIEANNVVWLKPLAKIRWKNLQSFRSRWTESHDYQFRHFARMYLNKGHSIDLYFIDYSCYQEMSIKREAFKMNHENVNFQNIHIFTEQMDAIYSFAMRRKFNK